MRCQCEDALHGGQCAGTADFLVQRDGITLHVCDRCDLTTDEYLCQNCLRNTGTERPMYSDTKCDACRPNEAATVEELLIKYEEATGTKRRDMAILCHPDDLGDLLTAAIRNRTRFQVVGTDEKPLQQGASMELCGVPVYTSRYLERGKVRVRPADYFRAPPLRPFLGFHPCHHRCVRPSDEHTTCIDEGGNPL